MSKQFKKMCIEMSNDSTKIHDIEGSVIGGKIEGTGNIVGQNVFVLTGSKDIETAVLERVLQKIAAILDEQLGVQESASSNQIRNPLTVTEMEILKKIASKLKEIENETGKKANEIKAGNVQLSREELLSKEAIIEGKKYLFKGEYDEAIKCYDKAISIDPSYAVAWYNKGTALHDLRRYKDAIYCYDKAIERDPNNGDAWNGKGVALYNSGGYDHAIYCYDKAIGLKGDFGLGWCNKGNALRKLKRWNDAKSCLERARYLGYTC